MKTSITVLLALASSFLVACGGSSSPGERIQEVHYAMEAGDAETVKEIVPGMIAIVGEEKLDGMIQEGAAQAKQKGGTKSITINKEEINGDTAKVNATVTWGNGEKETEDHQLSKVDGTWIVTIDLDGKGPR